ncbi:TetR/AcrR family transcriptional regulator [Roseomonas sp. F4]
MSDSEDPSPRRGSIGSSRNPASHKAILDAAAALLAEAGYAGVTMEAVARRAGAGKPTLYRWWPTKAALLMEVYAREKQAQPPIPDLGSAQRELVALLTRLHDFWRLSPAGQAYRSILAEAQADPTVLRSLRDEFLPRARESAKAILTRAMARGELNPAADTALMLDLLFGFSWYRLLTHQLRDRDNDVARIVAAVLAAGGGALTIQQPPQSQSQP